MVEAATQFRKNSFNDEDSAQLATIATLFQNVSDTEITAADSAGFIISQMKAFHIEAEDAVSIIDKVNEVANNFAVGTNDLSKALEVAGAGLSVYGNNYDEVIALVTSGSEILQGKSLQVARGLGTIAARIAKNEDELRKYNIDVYDGNRNMRSTYDILKDLSKQWNTMGDSQREALGQTLAGQNQFKVLAAVMENFQTAIDAVEVSEKAEGSAMRENARYLESYEAKQHWSFIQ